MFVCNSRRQVRWSSRPFYLKYDTSHLCSNQIGQVIISRQLIQVSGRKTEEKHSVRIAIHFTLPAVFSSGKNLVKPDRSEKVLTPSPHISVGDFSYERFPRPSIYCEY